MTPFSMHFSVSSLLEYEVTSPVTFILSIRARLVPGQMVSYENLQVPSGVDHYIQNCVATGTPFDRFNISQPGRYQIFYEANVAVEVETIPAGQLQDGGPPAFDAPVLPYLYPSRYCQSDRLGRLADDMFGHLQTPEEKVRATVDWIANHVSYVSGSTGTRTSAEDTLVERAGVCRDFAHLGIALCRAMSIPARYFTGYAFDLSPQDFHACFETFIGGRWLFWDASGMASPDGIVRIATGRDAADCAVCTAIGPLLLLRQEVTCTIHDPGYQKMPPDWRQSVSISLQPA